VLLLQIAVILALCRLATPLVTSVASIVIPFVLGSGVAAVAWYSYAPPGVGQLSFALFMGAAMSMTAFPVLVRILDDQQLLATPIGTLAVACAAFDDAAGWLILAVLTAVVAPGNTADAAVTLVGLTAYGLVMTMAARPLLARTVHARGATFGTRPADVSVILVILLLSAPPVHDDGLAALTANALDIALAPLPSSARIRSLAAVVGSTSTAQTNDDVVDPVVAVVATVLHVPPLSPLTSITTGARAPRLCL